MPLASSTETAKQWCSGFTLRTSFLLIATSLSKHVWVCMDTIYDLVISDKVKDMLIVKTVPGMDNGNTKLLAMSDVQRPLPGRLNRATYISVKRDPMLSLGVKVTTGKNEWAIKIFDGSQIVVLTPKINTTPCSHRDNPPFVPSVLKLYFIPCYHTVRT